MVRGVRGLMLYFAAYFSCADLKLIFCSVHRQRGQMEINRLFSYSFVDASFVPCLTCYNEGFFKCTA